MWDIYVVNEVNKENTGNTGAKANTKSDAEKVNQNSNNTSWYKEDGSMNYPPNNGAVVEVKKQ